MRAWARGCSSSGMSPSGPCGSVLIMSASWQRQQRFPRPIGDSAPQDRHRTWSGIPLQARQVGCPSEFSPAESRCARRSRSGRVADGPRRSSSGRSVLRASGEHAGSSVRSGHTAATGLDRRGCCARVVCGAGSFVIHDAGPFGTELTRTSMMLLSPTAGRRLAASR
jgi:hypothetical protein